MLDGFVVRGTTPTHEFELPYPVEIISEVHIVYGQNNRKIFTKTKQDCQITEGVIAVDLTQEETFLFSPKKRLDIEIRIKLINGTVARNEEPITLRVIDSMDEEVMK